MIRKPRKPLYIIILSMKFQMICFNCYTEFHPTLSKPFCPNCGICYWCRDFTCFHHDINNGPQERH